MKYLHCPIVTVVALMALALLTGVYQAAAQGTRFFRISGPAATTITAFRADGTLVWSNALPGTNYTVQTVTSLPGGTNWVDYVQIPVVNRVNTNQVIAFNPPSGMALIPAGSFTMGNCMDTNEGYSDELPLHTVYVSAIYMDKYDVTEALWQQVYNWATNHGYTFDNPGSVYDGYSKGPNYPVVDVDWYDCVKWCNARSEMEGRTPAYYTDGTLTTVYRSGDIDISNSCVNWNAGYRLPTEAEWEKAARGGAGGQRFPWGNTINESQANYYADPLSLDQYGYAYDVNSYTGYNITYNDGVDPYTSPVNAFAPNGYGLYDMGGNMWPWCWDWYDGSWYGNVGATQDDTRGPSGALSNRVLRGGCCFNVAINTRCAFRDGYYPDYPLNDFGFRCVRGF